MANVTAARQVFQELLGKYEGAEQMRNSRFGGIYLENNQAAKQMRQAFQKQFENAVTANDTEKMQAAFDALLKRFEGADRMRNYAASRRFVEDEKITKETVSAFRIRFAAAMAESPEAPEEPGEEEPGESGESGQ
jgi:hypothetical protein